MTKDNDVLLDNEQNSEEQNKEQALGNEQVSQSSDEQENSDNAKSKKKVKSKGKNTQGEFDLLKQQNLEHVDRYARLMAEFDNFRKRTAREKASMYDDGLRDAVVKLLPVVDNFERAMAALPEDNEMSGEMHKGFALILRQFKDQLTALGVNEIQSLGQPFDPNLHDAVMMADNPEFESGTVCEELLKGYIYKDKTLRHSMVKVAN